jgi:hypothetical protein
LEEGGKKVASLLEELCGSDTELYNVLKYLLFINPIAGISKKDLDVLLEETKKNVKELSYEMVVLEYRKVVDKAIFEASQNLEDRSRYIIIIKDLLSKILNVTEKEKEKLEKSGLTDMVTRLGNRINYWRIVSKRIEDIVTIATSYYNERLMILGENQRRVRRREARHVMGIEEKKEADLEEDRITKREDEDRNRRREERARARSKESE